MKFKLYSPYKPTGDQPQAIAKITHNLKNGVKNQTLVGVTGSGKTFTMASVIEKLQKPVLVLSHNKTLAAQLYQEFKEFFPENAIHYFVSYYDYYQPEAYIPQTDTYIEKDAKINEEIDRLRHAATQSLLTRNDVIVVASVSSIYNIGSPREYENLTLDLSAGRKIKRDDILKHLVSLQYSRNDLDPGAGNFRTRGEILEIHSPVGNEIIILELGASKIKSITKKSGNKLKTIKIWPAKHFVSPKEKVDLALANIENELCERLKDLNAEGKLLEAERLEQRTKYDLEMLRQVGYCSGIENYSRHLDFRKEGEPAFTLLDYFSLGPSGRDPERKSRGRDFITFIDESHMTVPQFRGMFNGDRSRKETLVNFGFRLPSALDNRPLKFDEFNKKINQVVFVSATPTEYEFEKSGPFIAEQLIRPTGLLDPKIEIRPCENQIKNLIAEIEKTTAKKHRVLVTTLTKRLAEDIAEHLLQKGLKVAYLHSEIKTLRRTEILKDLRLGNVDVLVGINLLREGLDLPEVALVAILDADKEGFLRNETSIVQTIGRAARHPEGRAILYADKITGSIKSAVFETERRRKIQEEHNRLNGITPKAIEKKIRENIVVPKENTVEIEFSALSAKYRVKELEQEMKEAARKLDFERAAQLRDCSRQAHMAD